MKVREVIFDVTESPEGGYEARALGYSIFTEGDDWDDLKTMARDAVLCHFDDGEAPAVIRLHLAPQEPLPSDNASCPSPSRPITPSDFAETAKSRLLAPQEPSPSGNASCPSPSRPITLSNFAETAKSDRLLVRDEAIAV